MHWSMVLTLSLVKGILSFYFTTVAFYNNLTVSAYPPSRAIRNREIHLLGVSTVARGYSSFSKCSRSFYIRLSPIHFLFSCFHPAQVIKEGADFVDTRLVLNFGKDACCQLWHGHQSKDTINPNGTEINFFFCSSLPVDTGRFKFSS